MKSFKVGIIGCGAIFPVHAEAIAAIPYAELAAVCDIDEEKARKKAEEYNCKYYTDYKKMINSTDVDAVHICLPHYLHTPVAINAAKAKKHVLCEKPMAIHLADAKNMIKEAEENGVVINVIFQNRYNDTASIIKKTLTNSELGKVRFAKANVCWCRDKNYYDKDQWRGTWSQEGGGVVINQAIHTLDLMRWFVDDEIEYIEANMGNRAHPYIEVEDYAQGTIAYKSGIITSFYTTNNNSYDAPVEIEIQCEKGTVKMVGEKARIIYENGKEVYIDEESNGTDENPDKAKKCWGHSHLKQIVDFYIGLSLGEELLINVKDVLKTQAMICAIYESGAKKKKVFL